MEIILYIYFGINLFIAGYWYSENIRWESREYSIMFLILSLLSSTVFVVYVGLLNIPPIKWIIREVRFWWGLKFTKYWDDILSSDEDKTKDEKLDLVKKLSTNNSKQFQRHSKIIIKKYATKKED